MDYEKLKEVIAKVIKENGQGEITGPALQMILMTMVDSLGEVYPQTYTAKQKAQARVNIDALSNYDGEITEEKLSAEVQAILNDVANKQNIIDESLATIAKTIVEAINEVYKGGLEDASIATSKIENGAVTEAKLNDVARAKLNDNVKFTKQTPSDERKAQARKNIGALTSENGGVKTPNLADGAVSLDKLTQSIQDTLGKVGTNVKELPDGTDLLSPNLEDGIWIVFCSKMTNVPSIFARYEIALLIVNSDRVVMMGTEASEEGYPIVARRGLKGDEWGTHTMISVAFNSFRGAVQEALDTKLDNTAGAVGAKNIADGAVTNAKIADNSITTEKLKDQAVEYAKLSASIRSTLDMVGMNVKVLPKGTDLLSDNIEEGIYILLTGSGEYENFPYTAGINVGAPMVLIKSSTSSMLFGFDSNSSDEFPIILIKRRGQSWYGNSIAKKFFNKLDNTSTLTDTAINNIWDNN